MRMVDIVYTFDCSCEVNYSNCFYFRKARKSSHFVGVMAGTLMAIFNLSFAVAFRVGGNLVTEHDVTLRDMMK